LADVEAITFLFTDVEGSTRLIEHDRAAADDALRRHHDLLSESVAAAGGTVFETVGDAVYAAFGDPGAAIVAAAAAQRSMASEPWAPLPPLRIRIALHLGDAERRGHRWFGIPLFVTARLLGLAHGGQTLVSAALAEAVRPTLDAILPGASLRPLGRHRVKDLRRPISVYQLDAPGLRSDFGSLRSLGATNLPVQPTPFRGREAELERVAALLDDPTVRLSTLTGPGGTGKTRLAIEAATRAADRFQDGVWWVALGSVTDAGLVRPAIASAVGAPGDPATYLSDWQALLVLDNLEQIPGAGREIGMLLEGCPGLRVIATSREPLHVRGERAHAVPTLGSAEAVALFRERALAARPDLELQDDVVAAICRTVDDLPLAIELAAARSNVLPPERLLERLTDRLGLLSHGSADAPDRQRTLRAAIAWSEDLLSPPERELFARFGLFAGAVDLEAAEAIVGATLDDLGGLVDKSLIRREGDRFGMLETIREYARGRCSRSPDFDGLRRRHALLYAGRVRASQEVIAEPAAGLARDRLEADLAEIRVAVEWALERPDASAARDLIANGFGFWILRQHGREAVSYARRFEQHLDLLPPAEAAVARMYLADLERYYGDPTNAIRLKEHGLASGMLDEADRAAVLHDLADLEQRRGELDRAAVRADTALAIRRRIGTPNGIAHALDAVGYVALGRGRPEAAVAAFDEALALVTDPEMRTFLALSAAEANRRAGLLDRSLALLVEASEAIQAGHDSYFAMTAVETSAGLALAVGEPARALRYAAVARRASVESGAYLDFPAELTRVEDDAAAMVGATERQRIEAEAGDLPLDVATDEILRWLLTDAAVAAAASRPT
jgi:predicted ATPase/class 3 adenylate cyclase